MKDKIFLALGIVAAVVIVALVITNYQIDVALKRSLQREVETAAELADVRNQYLAETLGR